MTCSNAFLKLDKKIDVRELLSSNETIKICAPMVRYSRLPFRMLVRKYGCDLAYTPMIVSNSFVRSEKCRSVDLVTNATDLPLVAQFAANNANDFASAAEIAYPFIDGVDLNCGCPQRWAMNEGYGAILLENPETVVDFIRTTRSRISDSKFSISTKIRIHEDVRNTVYLCQALEKIGVSYIAVHGRTTTERTQPVHYDVIKIIKDSLSIPVIANGDVNSLTSFSDIHKLTGCDGVMVARGLLNNPAMFDGYQQTPVHCISKWVDICKSLEIHFTLFHNHLIYMLAKVLSKKEKRDFNSLRTKNNVLEYLNNRFDLDCIWIDKV